MLLGEVDRRQVFRDDGATSAEAWAAERFGVSTPTARALHPCGCEGLGPAPPGRVALRGDVSFDKVRAVADVATPESDRSSVTQAKECTVRELADVARTSASRRPPPRLRPAPSTTVAYLRFNEACRTVTRPVAPRVLRRDPGLPRGPGPRRCPPTARPLGTSASVTPSSKSSARRPRRFGRPRLLRASASPYFVVVHVPLGALVDESGEASALAGELERDGLISVRDRPTDRL